MDPMDRNAEEPVYRAPATAPAPADEVDIDEEQYSSLKQAQAALSEGLEDLRFDLTTIDDTDEEDMRIDIRSRKYARAIIEPVKRLVDSAVENVDNKRKGIV